MSKPDGVLCFACGSASHGTAAHDEATRFKQRYVVGYLFSSDRKFVALIKKTNCSPEQRWQEGCFNGLGGKIAKVGTIDNPQKTWVTSTFDESPQQAMRREFKEEAGVDIPEENWDLYLTVEKKSNSDNGDIKLYMFRCFSTERLQQVKTNSSEGEVETVLINDISHLPIIDPARIFLALENRRFKMVESTI